MEIAKGFGPPSLVSAGFLSYTLLEYMRQKNIFRRSPEKIQAERETYASERSPFTKV
jgi:hypothetical protein